MVSTKFASARLGALVCGGLCFGQAETPRGSEVPGPTAVATNADVSYCFARRRGLDPSNQPPAYLVLQLTATIAYRNTGPRPLILPLEHQRTLFTGFKPDDMKVFKEGIALFTPAVKVMKRLPGDVGPDSPVDPKNDVFTVIPAGGEMTPPLLEEITLPVDKTGGFRQSPDLRGHRVYVKLRLLHQDLAASLKADLSDRWSRFGVPWTGVVSTQLIQIDVPASPQASPCKDVDKPAHRSQPVDGK